MNSILYLSQTGMTEPLGRSQVMEYLVDLAEHNSISLLSFERNTDIGAYENVEQLISGKDFYWKSLVYSNKYGVISSLLQIARGIKAGGRLIKEQQLDVIHARSMIPALMGLYLKKRYKKKLLFDIRGFAADERVDRERITKRSLTYRVLKYLEGILYKNSDHIVTLTHTSKKIIIDCYGVKEKDIDVIPTCVNGDIFRRISKVESNEFRRELGFSDKDKIIIHTGNISGWYLFDEEVAVIKNMMDMDDRVRLIVLNRNQHHLAEDILKRHHVEEDKVLIAQARFEEVHKYINISDASMYFIKPVFSKRASAPTKFAEMVACHVPSIVNTGVGDMDYYLNQYEVGCLVDLESVRNNAKLVAIELLDLIEHQKFSAADFTQLFNKHFDKKIAISKYQQIYDHLN